MDRNYKIARTLIYLRTGNLRDSISKQRELLNLEHFKVSSLIIDEEGVDNQLSLIGQIKTRKYDELKIYDLPSINLHLNSLQEFISFLSTLENSNVRLKILLSPNFDMNSPTSILAAFHDAKKTLHKEHIRKSLKERQHKGLNVGRPSAIPESDIKQLRNQGYTYKQIANELNISIGSVQRGLG